MAQKVVGLDIGRYSIKAAVFDASFRSLQLSNLIESSPITHLDPSDESYDEKVALALATLIEKYGLQQATFCSSLSGKDTLLRIKQYPFALKQALKVLPNEIDDDIPIPVEELMIEHETFIEEKNRTVLHAICVQHIHIQRHLDLLARAQVDPTFVSLDSIVLANNQQFLQHHPMDHYALVDIGHTKTSICIIADQKVAFLRTLYTGGQDIDEAIQTHLDLTLAQASEVKHKHGIVEQEGKPLQSQDLQKLSSAITTVVDPLLREVLQTISMYRGQTFLSNEQKKIEHIFLSGGNALIRDLDQLSTSITGLPSQVLSMDGLGVEMQADSQAKFATAIGTALKFSSRGKNQLPKDQINFRKGPYSMVQDYGQYKDQGLFYAKWFCVLFVLTWLFFGVKNQGLRSQYQTLEKRAVTQYKNYVADAGRVSSSKTALRMLKQKLNALEQKQELLTSGLNQLTALDILLELSKQIPESISLDAEEISIANNKVVLRAKTTSYASVDQIVNRLEKYEHFERIEKGNMKETADQRIEFQITMMIGDNPKTASGINEGDPS
jgi:type IV pilus assembly protein PilM